MGLLTKWKSRNALRRLDRQVAEAAANVDPEVVWLAGNYMGQLRNTTPVIVGQDAIELRRPDNTRVRVEAKDGSLYSYTISPQGQERELNLLPTNGRDFYRTNVLEDMVGQNGGHLTFRDRTGAWLKKHGRWAGLAGGLGTVGLVWAYHAIPGTPKVTSPKELADLMTLLYTNMGPSLFYTAAGFLSAVAGAIPGYVGLRNLLEDGSRYTRSKIEGRGAVNERRRLQTQVDVLTDVNAAGLSAYREGVERDIQTWRENEQTIATRINTLTEEQGRLTALLRTYGEKTNQQQTTRRSLSQSLRDLDASVRLQLSLHEQTSDPYYHDQTEAYSKLISTQTETLRLIDEEAVKIRSDEQKTRTRLDYLTIAVGRLQALYSRKQELGRSKTDYLEAIPSTTDTVYGRLRAGQEALMNEERALLNRIDQGLPLN